MYIESDLINWRIMINEYVDIYIGYNNINIL